jgi:hypothetical protein
MLLANREKAVPRGAHAMDLVMVLVEQAKQGWRWE